MQCAGCRVQGIQVLQHTQQLQMPRAPCGPELDVEVKKAVEWDTNLFTGRSRYRKLGLQAQLTQATDDCFTDRRVDTRPTLCINLSASACMQQIQGQQMLPR